MANFLFPEDQKKTKGAVRITADGLDFFVPTVLHSSDGVTPIGPGNPLTTAVLTIAKTDPVFIGTGNASNTFTKSMFAFAINNKGASSLTFTIDGSTITVDAGGAFYEQFEPFTQVDIVASGAWEAYGLTYPNLSGIITPPEPTPDTTPPNDVTNLVVSNLAATSLTLGWAASTSSDIALYDVYKGSTLLGTVAGLTCNVTGLTASTAYTFTVKAKDASNNVSAGLSIDITTSAPSSDTTAPANVTNLTTASVTQTTLTLNWTASTDNVAVTGYDVFNGSTFLATVTGTTYNVTGLSASTAYTFTVKARDAAGNLATGTSVGVTTSAPADTTAPVLTITPAAGTYTTTQTVSMSATDSGSTPTIYYTLDGSTPTTSSSVYSSALSVSATTTVKAFARDAAGNNSAVQTLTYTINLADTTAPNPVTGLTAGTPTSSSVPLSWTLSSSGDVTAQKVEYSSDSGGTWTTASAAVNPSSTSYTVTGLTASTAYSFRVSALDAANNQSTFATTTATTAAATPVFTTSGLKVWLDGHDGTGTQTTWGDKSSNANNATLTNFNFDATDGWQVDSSLKGDGTNDYVVTSGNLGLTGSGQARTVQFKVKVNSMTDKAILGFGSGTSGYFDVLLYQNNICVYEGTAVSSIKQAATNGSTYDIAFVYNGTALTMYLNGVLQSGSYTKVYNTLDSPLYMLKGGGSGFQFSANQLYYVAVYNRALTASEVLSNYNVYA